MNNYSTNIYVVLSPAKVMKVVKEEPDDIEDTPDMTKEMLSAIAGSGGTKV